MSVGPTLLLLYVFGGNAGLDGADLRLNGRVNNLKNGLGGIIECRCSRNASTDVFESNDDRSWRFNSTLNTNIHMFTELLQDTSFTSY